MAKKTYKTYHLKGLQVLLFDEQGRPMEVNFKGGVQVDSTAKFSTSDEKVQEALEKCSGFNRDYYLDSVSEDKPVAAPVPEVKEDAVEEAPAVEVEEVAEETSETETAETEKAEAEDNGNVVKVSTKGDAVEWLKEHYPEEGYTSVKLRGKAFDEACKKHGVEFEIG